MGTIGPVSDSLDEFDLLICDSSVLFRFFEAGVSCTERLMGAFAERLYIVDSVDQEIQDHRHDPDKAAAIAAFRERTTNQPLESPLSVTNRVQEARDLNRKYGLGGSDIGEMETVFYADWAWDHGDEYLILMGDSYGRQLAEQRELPTIMSYEFLMALIRRGALTADEGVLVAASIFGDRFDQSIYDRDVRRL